MNGHDSEQQLLVAQAVRTACVQAAERAYHEAAMSGLCCEGAWEAALGAIRALDVDAVVEESTTKR